MMQGMSRGERAYFVTALAVGVAAFAIGWPAVRPPENSGPVRFDHSVIRVDLSGTREWGQVDPSAFAELGQPVEFVDHDADVTFRMGETKSQEVEGFGTLYVAAETNVIPDRDRWVGECRITLSTHGDHTPRKATAIAVHEYGHCLGLEHDDTELSIMSTVIDSETVPNPLFSYRPTDADRHWVQVQGNGR